MDTQTQTDVVATIVAAKAPKTAKAPKALAAKAKPKAQWAKTAKDPAKLPGGKLTKRYAWIVAVQSCNNLTALKAKKLTFGATGVALSAATAGHLAWCIKHGYAKTV
jgi:hypothetical protein